MAKPPEQRAWMAVLKPGVELTNLFSFTTALGFNFGDYVEREDDVPMEYVWITQDRSTTLNYIEDHRIDLNYVVARGRDRDALHSRVVAHLGAYSFAELARMYERAARAEEAARAVFYALVSIPPAPDERFLRLFRHALARPERVVRFKAIEALAACEWPGALESLRPTLIDPDPVVAAEAQRIYALASGASSRRDKYVY